MLELASGRLVGAGRIMAKRQETASAPPCLHSQRQHGTRTSIESRAQWVCNNCIFFSCQKLTWCRVTDLRPNDTEDTPFFYTFKVQCTSCRETHPNLVSVSRFEQNEVSGSKGEANFVWRCKNCKVFLPLSSLS
jgi:hypothetical protein